MFKRWVDLGKPEKLIIGPPKAGPETEALKRFYSIGKSTWTGTVKAGMMVLKNLFK